jgi:hypothetical protein
VRPISRDWRALRPQPASGDDPGGGRSWTGPDSTSQLFAISPDEEPAAWRVATEFPAHGIALNPGDRFAPFNPIYAPDRDGGGKIVYETSSVTSSTAKSGSSARSSAWWTSRSIIAAAVTSSPKISLHAENGLLDVTISDARS